MIFYLTILIAFLWLGVETRWFTVRLPCGVTGCPRKPVEAVRGSEPSTEPPTPLLLTEQCYLSKVHEIMGRQARDHTYGWSPGGYDTKEKPSYQQMVIGSSTITLKATLPNLHKRITELEKASKSNPAPPRLCRTIKPPLNGIEQEYQCSTEPLCGKRWLKKHWNDHRDFEPTMEVIVDGKTLSVNGNYKSGVVKDFIKSRKP